MRIYDIKQVKVIHEETAEEFEAKLNEALEEIGDPKTEVQYNFGKGFCAYLTYTAERRTLEGAKDHFNNEGIRYLCAECPYCEASDDKRVKWCYCDMKPTGRTRKDSEACEFFYRSVAQGEIKPEVRR